MKPMFINHNKIDQFVEAQNDKGNHLSWDGWDVLAFRPDPRARVHRRGVYVDGQWGYQNRIKVTTKGCWVFDRNLIV